MVPERLYDYPVNLAVRLVLTGRRQRFPQAVQYLFDAPRISLS
jgi:hypothetical protein